MRDAQLYFIAGPTASGKSAAALALGMQTGGVIVNA
ncbi:tRNA dimethylallyltransferase, partial [hydrothermal vent metagenome]